MEIQNQFGYTEDEAGIWELVDSPEDGSTVDRPFVFLRDNIPTDELEAILTSYIEAGAGGIIPYLPSDISATTDDPSGAVFVRRDFYSKLLPLAEKLGLKVALTLDRCIERAWSNAEDAVYEDETRAEVITAKTYPCLINENVTLTLHDGERMALCAINEESGEAIDLRDKIVDGTVTWSAPYGNWSISEYICSPDYESERINLLSYSASIKFIRAAFTLFEDILLPYMGNVITMVCYRHVCFSSRNRRDWDKSFNRVFAARYGFDPAPYYPALFGEIENDTAHLKALFFDCRARMLRDGFLRAVDDFAAEHGLTVFGNISEPKLSQCSPITGDALLDNTVCPCGVFERAYLYGINSVKVAAGAAFGLGLTDVGCELFRDYGGLKSGHYLRDAEHAIARGSNLTVMHLPRPTEKNEVQMDLLCAFGRRMRRILRGTRQIADIAVIYPIYSLHSSVNLYDTEANGYEYPDTPNSADYMTVINSICLWSGHDVTLVHPDAVAGRAEVGNGILRMAGQKDDEAFRAVFLPAASMCSLACMRVLRDFFDAGGKIIATGELPELAFEFTPGNDSADLEMREIRDHIFGAEASNPLIMRNHCHNKGANGGEAYFLYFSLTAADGTAMVNSHDIGDALRALGINFDIYMPDLPRYESSGALNNPYNEFTRLGLEKHLPDGGMFSHRHARRNNEDIYFMSNTTDGDAETPIYLRGAHEPRLYLPLTGKYHRCRYRHVNVGGEIYTTTSITLKTAECAVLISDDEEERHLSVDISKLPDETARAKRIHKTNK